MSRAPLPLHTMPPAPLPGRSLQGVKAWNSVIGENVYVGRGTILVRKGGEVGFSWEYC